MKIVQLADIYAPVIGGAERHVLNLAQELAARGHDSVVVTIGAPNLPLFETDDKGVRVYRLRSGLTSRIDSLFTDPARRYHPPVADPGLTHGLARLLDGLQPDIVNGHNWMTYSYLAGRRRGDTAVVHTLHDYGAVCHKRTYLRADGSTCDGPALAKCARCGVEQYGVVKSAGLATGLRLSQHRLHPHVDRFIAVSRYVADVSRPYLGGRPVEVVPTFVPDGLDVLAAATPRAAFLPDRDFILFVGSLTRVKGLDTLIDAHRQLGPSAPALVAIGPPTAGLPTGLGPNVVIAPTVPHAQVMSAWHHCLFGVVPSRLPEPLGQAAVEAMVCGKAVVASRTGGLAELIGDRESGLLVDPGHTAQLAAALRELIDDPALRDRLGAEGARRAPAYTQSHVVDRFEEIYRELRADRVSYRPVPTAPDPRMVRR